MEFENRVKKLLAKGRPAWGAAVVVTSELAAKLTVDTGVDFIWIDTEHSSFGIEAVHMQPLIARMSDCVPLVRVAGLDPNLIKKALDIGASAIMVPQINNAEEARLAVRYAKYPPQGIRGVSPMWTFLAGVDWGDYLPEANDETCVVVQVESPEAIDKVEEIAAIEGVDVVFAGPMDLSAALGHIGNTEHPEVQRFLAEFPKRVARSGKASGISVAGVEAARKAYCQGYRFINFGSILWAGVLGLTADLRQLREL